jgi:galactokinase
MDKGDRPMVALDRIPALLDSRSGKETLTSLYGTSPARLAHQRERYLRLASLFAGMFPQHASVRAFSTPGRTEVSGNHTDHQRGHVLCASVDLDILAFAAPNSDGVVRIHSEGYDKTDVIALSDQEPLESERYHSASLIRGIAAGFVKRGFCVGGFDAYTTSEVPKGSGLSSSAAFEVLVATMFDTFYNGEGMPAVTRAQISQYSENVFFGKPSGLMDQCGCSVGGFLAIDFADTASPVLEAIPFDLERAGYALVIANTGGSHADLNDEYAAIPIEMRRVAAFLGKTVLREVDPEAFYARLADVRRETGDRAVLRAMHFFDDDARVCAQAAALNQGDLDTFLRLVNESGISSWTMLQNISASGSIEEQPMAVALGAAKHALQGRGACRVHGGGFAGTIQAFVPLDLVDGYMAVMGDLFGADSPCRLRIRALGSSSILTD